MSKNNNIPNNLITATDVDAEQKLPIGGTFGKAVVYRGGDTWIDESHDPDPKTGVLVDKASRGKTVELDSLNNIKTADTTNATTSLNITNSEEDRGAKWARPQAQDVHDKGRNQYESHN